MEAVVFVFLDLDFDLQPVSISTIFGLPISAVGSREADNLLLWIESVWSLLESSNLSCKYEGVNEFEPLVFDKMSQQKQSS